jgi:hypothetical protein
MEGVGKWFATRAEAWAYVDKHFKDGARSFDVGCFQLNYRWHGEQFSSIDAMFDPFKGAQYAAEFLTKLYDETGDWSAAVAAYHSRTPKYATEYLARFTRVHNGLVAKPVVADTHVKPSEIPAISLKNTFPLLQADGSSGLYGSLVPLDYVAQSAFLIFEERRNEK